MSQARPPPHGLPVLEKGKVSGGAEAPGLGLGPVRSMWRLRLIRSVWRLPKGCWQMPWGCLQELLIAEGAAATEGACVQ